MVSKYLRVIVPAILTIGLVAGAAQLASSNTGMSHGHMRHHGARSLGIPMRLLLKNANLTDAQKTQLHQIISSRLATRKAEWQQLHAAKEQILAKYVSTGPVSASDLSGPLQQVTQIKDQMAQEQLQDAIAIRNLAGDEKCSTGKTVPARRRRLSLRPVRVPRPARTRSSRSGPSACPSPAGWSHS